MRLRKSSMNVCTSLQQNPPQGGIYVIFSYFISDEQKFVVHNTELFHEYFDTSCFLKLVDSQEFSDTEIILENSEVIRAHQVFLYRIPELSQIITDSIMNEGSKVKYIVKKGIEK